MDLAYRTPEEEIAALRHELAAARACQREAWVRRQRPNVPVNSSVTGKLPPTISGPERPNVAMTVPPTMLASRASTMPACSYQDQTVPDR